MEIFRNRRSLTGLSGPPHEPIEVGRSFSLGDADHIEFRYTLLEIRGNRLIFDERDNSRRLEDDSTHTRVRRLTVTVYDDRILISEDEAIRLATAEAENHQGFSKPFMQTLKKGHEGAWVIKFLSQKPSNDVLSIAYIYVTIDSKSGDVIRTDAGGGA